MLSQSSWNIPKSGDACEVISEMLESSKLNNILILNCFLSENCSLNQKFSVVFEPGLLKEIPLL